MKDVLFKLFLTAFIALQGWTLVEVHSLRIELSVLVQKVDDHLKPK